MRKRKQIDNVFKTDLVPISDTYLWALYFRWMGRVYRQTTYSIFHTVSPRYAERPAVVVLAEELRNAK